ncbi:uncharacterized protein LOC117332227 [Pecten maximus]|uniref:uncharacterized protein LOC117332227 n=1 Tax=Pecten maximus TaxID=6579 RepID=UPI0014581F11|nr:uncharacterized protein LOC117332227 [Pecten maximus]
MVVTCVLLLAFLSTGMGQHCKPGVTENVATGCRNYYACVNGVGHLVTCEDVGKGFVYNSATKQCDDPHNVQPPCGQQKDCTGKGDRNYADKDNQCHSYYTCNRDTFFGHTICATCKSSIFSYNLRMPHLREQLLLIESKNMLLHYSSLVFDESLQTCNWPQNVLPPCGTKTTTT